MVAKRADGEAILSLSDIEQSTCVQFGCGCVHRQVNMDTSKGEDSGSDFDEESLFLPTFSNDNLTVDPDNDPDVQDRKFALSFSSKSANTEYDHPRDVYASPEQRQSIESESSINQSSNGWAPFQGNFSDESTLPSSQLNDLFNTNDDALGTDQWALHDGQAGVLLPVECSQYPVTLQGPPDQSVLYHDHMNDSSNSVGEKFPSSRAGYNARPCSIGSRFSDGPVAIEELELSMAEVGHSLACRVERYGSSSQGDHAPPSWTTTPSQTSRSSNLQQSTSERASTYQRTCMNGAEPKESSDSEADSHKKAERDVIERPVMRTIGRKTIAPQTAAHSTPKKVQATISPRTNKPKQPIVRRRASATGVKKAWEPWEKQKVDMVMNDLIKQNRRSWSGKNWEQACQILRDEHSVDRTWRAIKNEWSRYGRKRTGQDERNNPEGRKLVTGYESPTDRKAKRRARKMEEARRTLPEVSESQPHRKQLFSTPHKSRKGYVRNSVKPKAVPKLRKEPFTQAPSHVLPAYKFPNNTPETLGPPCLSRTSYQQPLDHTVHLQHLQHLRPLPYSNIPDWTPQQHSASSTNHQHMKYDARFEGFPKAHGQSFPSYAAYMNVQEENEVNGIAPFQHHKRRIEEVFEDDSDEPPVDQRKTPCEQAEA